MSLQSRNIVASFRYIPTILAGRVVCRMLYGPIGAFYLEWVGYVPTKTTRRTVGDPHVRTSDQKIPRPTGRSVTKEASPGAGQL